MGLSQLKNGVKWGAIMWAATTLISMALVTILWPIDWYFTALIFGVGGSTGFNLGFVYGALLEVDDG